MSDLLDYVTIDQAPSSTFGGTGGRVHVGTFTVKTFQSLAGDHALALARVLDQAPNRGDRLFYDETWFPDIGQDPTAWLAVHPNGYVDDSARALEFSIGPHGNDQCAHKLQVTWRTPSNDEVEDGIAPDGSIATYNDPSPANQTIAREQLRRSIRIDYRDEEMFRTRAFPVSVGGVVSTTDQPMVMPNGEPYEATNVFRSAAACVWSTWCESPFEAMRLNDAYQGTTNLTPLAIVAGTQTKVFAPYTAEFDVARTANSQKREGQEIWPLMIRLKLLNTPAWDTRQAVGSWAKDALGKRVVSTDEFGFPLRRIPLQATGIIAPDETFQHQDRYSYVRPVDYSEFEY